MAEPIKNSIKNSITRFFENVLNKRKDPIYRERKEIEENIKQYSIRKIY